MFSCRVSSGLLHALLLELNSLRNSWDQLSQERTLLRLDGQYGNGAVLSDVAGFAFVTRGKDYHLLDHLLVQTRLHLPPDQIQQRPESPMVRSLYDCPEIPVGPEGTPYRVVVATHPAGKKKSPVGVTRAGVVYELFFTSLPQHAFTASDVVELYLHRGAFEPVLSDEDREQDPDRWCSHAAWGQECWQLVSQWVWNAATGNWAISSSHSHCARPSLLQLSHLLHPTPLLLLAMPRQQVGSAWKAGRFTGQDFALQPDGTLLCPADQKLTPHEQRREADGSLCIVYGASIHSCRPCLKREQCQWQGSATKKPRQVSVLLHPLAIGPAPLLWRDWSRREHRRACLRLLRDQRVEVKLPSLSPSVEAQPINADGSSRALRARTTVSRGRRVWLATHGETLLARSQSSSLGSPTTLHAISA